jgi:hypothetical protein
MLTGLTAGEKLRATGKIHFVQHSQMVRFYINNHNRNQLENLSFGYIHFLSEFLSGVLRELDKCPEGTKLKDITIMCEDVCVAKIFRKYHYISSIAHFKEIVINYIKLFQKLRFWKTHIPHKALPLSQSEINSLINWIHQMFTNLLHKSN